MNDLESKFFETLGKFASDIDNLDFYEAPNYDKLKGYIDQCELIVDEFILNSQKEGAMSFCNKSSTMNDVSETTEVCFEELSSTMLNDYSGNIPVTPDV